MTETDPARRFATGSRLASLSVREEQTAFACRPAAGAAPDGDVVACGEAAAEGLAQLITDAVRLSDDERVAGLDRVLRQVEQLVDLARSR